ncbi:MAG: ribonuclease R [Deltaproteobacteria bacterium]|nr:ribonuclease R [Deltaproteobacteria bacterium]
MKSQKKSIMRMMGKNMNSMSAKQIRGALGIKKSAVAKLKAELQNLINEGKIYKQGSRYFLAVKKESVSENRERIKSKYKKYKDHFITFQQPLKWHKTSSSKTETGVFTRNQKGFGFVAIGRGLSDIFISQREQGFAMEGDLVEIEIYNKSSFRGKRKGTVVRVLERASKEILARLKRTRHSTLAVPINLNSGLPDLFIAKEDDLPELESGTLIEAEILEAQSRSKKQYPAPCGRVIRGLNDTSDQQLGFQLILKENMIRTEFPQETLDHLKNFPSQVRYDPASRRQDLRDLDFVTIDGKNARDFDDAVCVIPDIKSQGGFRLFVSIADVAHYVKLNDPVDKEAMNRGTSVYFPSHAVPMLPEVLSNNLCSLRENVNRLTLTCEMRICSEGNVTGYSISESIIRSKARLVYEDVADLIEGRPSSINNPKLKSNIRRMHKLAKILEKKRIKRGAVQFSFAEEVFEYDDDKQIVGVAKSYPSCSMKLIEQFMLEANETIAHHCVKNKIPALFRVHDVPDSRKLRKMQQVFFRFGVRTPLAKLVNPRQFNNVIDQIQDLPQFEQLQVLLLRAIPLAIYLTVNKGHFGLAADYYAHFTSPIRRYPDLVVHRAIKQKINQQYYINKKSQRNIIHNVSGEMAELCSQQERRAEKAERQSIDLMKVGFLAPRTGQTFQASVTSVEKRGFKVNLESHGIEWFLPIESMPDDSYYFDETALFLHGRRKNRTLQVGQRLEIRLLRADPVYRMLDFEVERWLERVHDQNQKL